MRRFLNFCQFLPDVPEIFPIWERLVTQHGVGGYKAHDLRLVAAMEAYGVGRVLTLNTRHFTGFGVQPLEPAEV